MDEGKAQERTFWGFNARFWVLVIGTFINTAGSALVFPFIALYIGRRFGATEVEVGFGFTVFAVVSLVAGAAGGALTDRFGRKRVMIAGLIGAIAFSLGIAFATSWLMSLAVIALLGPFGAIFGPASNAMVADMLPEEKQARGYGLVRVAANLGVVIGPLLGGLVADQPGGFLWLFVGDAITSGIFALIIAFMIPETMPQRDAAPGGLRDALKLFDGYGVVVRDVPFVLFSLIFLAVTVVYSQMNTNLVLYLDKAFSIPARDYSLLIALNAAMVVLFQFPLTAYVERYRQTAILVLGTLCYGVGFGMFGYVGQMWWLALGMAILTVGEMLLVPTAQAAVAQMSPEDMRGRYMGFYGLVWGASFGIGPLAGGMILAAQGGAYRQVLWQLSLVICILSAGAFVVMGRYLKRRAARIRWAELMARYGEHGKTTPAEAAAATGTPLIPGA